MVLFNESSVSHTIEGLHYTISTIKDAANKEKKPPPVIDNQWDKRKMGCSEMCDKCELEKVENDMVAALENIISTQWNTC